MMVTAAVISSKMKIRAVIKYFWLKNYKPLQICRDVCGVYDDKIISRRAQEPTFALSKAFLSCFDDKGNAFLDKIVMSMVMRRLSPDLLPSDFNVLGPVRNECW